MDPEAFIRAFFGEGNDLGREDIDRSENLRRLVDDVTSPARPPVVLPRRTDSHVTWYVIPRSSSQARRIAPEVRAFVGPSWARWTAPEQLNVDDTVDAAAMAFAQGRILRFTNEGNKELAECWKVIDRMRTSWAQRPSDAQGPIRTGAALLADFEEALAGGDPALGEDRLTELRRRGLISAENGRFLEIRLLAAAGRWGTIATAPDLEDLARIRRPWLVTESLLTALYRVHLRPLEGEGNPDDAIRRARELGGSLEGLFLTVGPLRDPDAVSAIAAVRAGRPGASRQDITQLAETPGLPGPTVAWIQALAETVGPPEATPSTTAREAMQEGNLDRAYRLACTATPSRETAEILLQCAFEVETLEAASRALAAIGALAEPDRDAVLKRRANRVALQAVTELVAPRSDAEARSAPVSWVAWGERLVADPDWKSSQAVAICGELEFTSDDMDAEAAQRLAETLLEVADSNRRSVLRDALPRLVSWMGRNDLDPAAERALGAAIMTVLALSDDSGEAGLEVGYTILESQLRVGLTDDEYGELMDQLTLLWERRGSRATAGWLADVYEQLDLHPGPAEPAVAFVSATLQRVAERASRIDEVVLEGLRIGATALAGAELAERTLPDRPEEETTAQDEVGRSLVGKTIAIYTLDPQVATRARDAILRRFPRVHVELDASLVSTPTLVNLARTADYFILAVRSAKHAATDAIGANRPPDLPLIWPRGRGSTRMVQALVEAVTRDAL